MKLRTTIESLRSSRLCDRPEYKLTIFKLADLFELASPVSGAFVKLAELRRTAQLAANKALAGGDSELEAGFKKFSEANQLLAQTPIVQNDNYDTVWSKTEKELAAKYDFSIKGKVISFLIPEAGLMAACNELIRSCRAGHCSFEPFISQRDYHWLGSSESEFAHTGHLLSLRRSSAFEARGDNQKSLEKLQAEGFTICDRATALIGSLLYYRLTGRGLSENGLALVSRSLATTNDLGSDNLIGLSFGGSGFSTSESAKPMRFGGLVGIQI